MDLMDTSICRAYCGSEKIGLYNNYTGTFSITLRTCCNVGTRILMIMVLVGDAAGNLISKVMDKYWISIL